MMRVTATSCNAAALTFAWLVFSVGASALEDAGDVRAITVDVTDASGAPISDAAIEAIGGYRPLTSSKTDVHGRAELKIGADEPVQWIVGLKSQVGFDYFENPGSQGIFLPRAARELPEVVKLKLEGARTVRIHAEGEKALDVAGVRFVPWVLSKRGKRNFVNLSGSGIASATSDVHGIATFDWLPSQASSAPREEQGATFLAASEKYDWCDPPDVVPYSADGVELKAFIQLKGTISGKVTLPDGKPAAGTKILAEGRGHTVHVCCQTTVTAADGSFAMKVSPGQVYMVAVDDEKWTATTHAGIEMREGASRNDVNFALSKGLLIRGKAIGPEGKNPVGNLVFLRYKGPKLSKGYWGPVQELFPNAALVRQSVTGAGGSYAFRVPPGAYELGIGAGEGADDATHYRMLPVEVKDQNMVIDLPCKRSTNPARTTASPVKANYGDPYDFTTLRVRVPGGIGCNSCHRPVIGR